MAWHPWLKTATFLYPNLRPSRPQTVIFNGHYNNRWQNIAAASPLCPSSVFPYNPHYLFNLFPSTPHKPMPSHALLILADDLFHRRLAESDLPEVTAHIPALDEETIHTLIRTGPPGQPYPTSVWLGDDAGHGRGRKSHRSPFPTSTHRLASWSFSQRIWLIPSSPAGPGPARPCHLFTTLNEPVWLALCTWQENPLSWVSQPVPKHCLPTKCPGGTGKRRYALCTLPAPMPSYSSNLPTDGWRFSICRDPYCQM